MNKVLLLFLIFSSTLISAQETKKNVIAKRVSKAPKIDGVLNDDAWMGADVAKETTVIPITAFGIDKFSERETEDFNNQSPPLIKSSKPTTIAMNAILKIFHEDTASL